jgi:hypothetical protein
MMAAHDEQAATFNETWRELALANKQKGVVEDEVFTGHE